MDFWALGLEELVCCRPKEDRRLRDSSGVARARNRRQATGDRMIISGLFAGYTASLARVSTKVAVTSTTIQSKTLGRACV